jgi:hypothetical protein
VTNRRQVACYVRAEIAEAFAQLARARNSTISSVLSAIVEVVVEGQVNQAERIDRRILFIETAVDALLATHPDSNLRAHTHEVYRSRLREAGLAQ